MSVFCLRLGLGCCGALHGFAFGAAPLTFVAVGGSLALSFISKSSRRAGAKTKSALSTVSGLF